MLCFIFVLRFICFEYGFWALSLGFWLGPQRQSGRFHVNDGKIGGVNHTL